MSRLGDAATDAIVAAVRRVAAAEILPRFRALSEGQVDRKSSADDLVTIADTAAEAALEREIAGILPDARIVGEEAVSRDKSLLDGIAGPGLSVVIDPIDGTWNYANGVATYGVILAVVEDGETVFGMIYDPSFDDWVLARRGGGAWFCRPDAAPARIRASGRTGPLEECFGFVGMYLFPKADQALIAATLPRFRRTMTLRASAHEYRMICQGRGDFVLNGMLNAWDHAAGVLAFREAGGVARLLDGRDYAPTMRDGLLLTAATEPLWAELAALWSGLLASQA